MPGTAKKEPANRPWDSIGEYVEENHLHLKFGTATHDHWDHFFIYPQFHNRFPNVPIIAHESFFPGEELAHFITPEDINKGEYQTASLIRNGTPIYCYKEPNIETDLAGEPLYLLHAPKHSLTDTMVIFQGSMIAGDWWLGPGDPNPNKVPLRTIHTSIDFLEQFCRQKNYVIHNIFAVHGNEFRWDVNFKESMESTRP